ncbi:uncharacterized protein [Lepeophtheirus salmonis]|uniref:uncharacterized protein isoform X2 n=1 Tax=Lepeophtheirus salmonis TaxID=72036 RepID=UPI001AE25FB3|nr:mediator of RNA polymerase II transcription subunit 26-like isoform X2 [Lepeophtheirus salmonis]
MLKNLIARNCGRDEGLSLHVVDMGVVVDVLSQLENYAITKEALEATRLGKHINELRRKAQDKLLANRAKSLVKKWRQLLVVPNSTTETPPPGGGGAGSLIVQNHTTATTEKPTLNGGSYNPSFSSVKNRHLSPAIRPLSNGVRNTSPGIINNNHSLPSSASTSPGLSRPTTPTTATTRLNNSNGRPVSPVVIDSVSKTNPANKRLRKDCSPNLVVPPGKRVRANGDQDFLLDTDTKDSFVSVADSDNAAKQSVPDSNKNSFLSPEDDNNESNSSFSKQQLQRKTRMPKKLAEQKPDTLQRQMQSVRKASGKVLTTQDLVQQLALRSQSPVLVSNNLNENNHHHHALHNDNNTELPSSQQETNSQLMSRFFDSQDRLSPPVSSSATSPDPIDSTSSTRCSSAAALHPPSNNEEKGDAVDAILSQLPPINREEILAEIQREIAKEEDEEEIDGLIPIKKEPKAEITDELVEKLHTDQVESLTGNFDAEGAFHEWHEVVGKTSKEGDLLYILPYCIID